MSSQNRQHPQREPPPPPYPHHFVGRGLPPPHLLNEISRDGGPLPPVPLPPPQLLGPLPPPQRLGPLPLQPPAVMEERLAAQNHDIRGMLVDNQRLAATHVALKQEVAAVHYELQRAAHALATLNAESDLQSRDVHEKSMKMESELRAVEAIRVELIQVRGDIQKLHASRQELTTQMQALTQDLTRADADLQHAPALQAEIENLKQEIQRTRAAIEYEKKGYADNYEQGQAMERNLISMAREVEKLQSEISNTEKRARAAAAAGNKAAGYGVNYGNADPTYGGNPLPGYAINPVPGGGVDGAPQYGSGTGHGSWIAYDPQGGQGRR